VSSEPLAPPQPDAAVSADRGLLLTVLVMVLFGLAGMLMMA
jgi:hypothetical protein